MKRTRCTAVAIALFLLGAALATAGCGVGAGDEAGEVSLTVTRDFGAERLVGPLRETVTESDTVMRVLDREAEISTRYGGGFVSSIEGLAEAVRGGRRHDWFFYVNGVESSRGAADFDLRGGEAIWWDYHDWSAAPRVPAVVGSFPRPLRDGYDELVRPVSLQCRGPRPACAAARGRLLDAAVPVTAASPDGAIRVLVGSWARLREDPAAAQLERGPSVSGVFAELRHEGGRFALRALDEGGEPARDLGPDAGLVAATRRVEAPPVWLVTGTSAAGVRAAAALLDAASLRDRYAVAVEGGEEIPLPVEGR